MTATNGGVDAADLLPGAIGELAHIRALMEGLLVSERNELIQLVVGNFDRREIVLQESPGPRSKRLIVPRTGQGASGVAVPTTIVEVVEQNEGRLGGLIVNTGAVPVRLYFATPGDVGGIGNAPSGQAQNRPAGWLAAGGGSFDFRFGNVLYGGTVCAAGVGGASTLDWAEF